MRGGLRAFDFLNVGLKDKTDDTKVCYYVTHLLLIVLKVNFSLRPLQKRPARSTQDLRGTCTWSRVSSSSAVSSSSLPRTLPCRRRSVTPSSWVSPLKRGWTAVYGPSGLQATCAANRLHPAPQWDFAPKPHGAPRPQTPSLNWAQSKATDGSGSPRRGETVDLNTYTGRLRVSWSCTRQLQENLCEAEISSELTGT